METVRGVGGYCEPNAAYKPETTAEPPQQMRKPDTKN